MRTCIGIIIASLIAPTVATAAGTAQVDIPKETLEAARAQCANNEKSDLCSLVNKMHDAKAKAPASTAQQKPAKAAVAAQSPTPVKIPPLIQTPFVPPWYPLNPVGGHYACTSDTQGLYIRQDALDNFHYLVDPSSPSSTDPSASSAGSATGASISYTDDHVAKTQSATVNGRVSYLIFGDTNCDAPNTREPFLYGFALAPFIASTGTWTEPLKKTSNSALQMGTDFQIAVSTANFSPLLDYNYFYASPYHQTDLRDLADINGVLLAWEPVAYQLYMGFCCGFCCWVS